MRESPQALAAATILAVSVFACAPEGSQDSGPDLVLPHVTIIDGLGGPPIVDQTIEIRDGLITAVRPSAAGDDGLDVAGLFVTPGLIDTHQHLPAWDSDEAVVAALGSLLDVGITSVREMACCGDVYARVTASQDSTDVSRLFWSSFWAGSTFMAGDPRVRDSPGAGAVPWLLAVDSSTDLEPAVRAAQVTGATGIKIYSDISPGLVADIARVGHQLGLRVWTHPVVFPTRPSEVVAAGADVISHAALFVWEVVDELPSTYNDGHPFNPFGPPAPYSTVFPDDPRVVAVLESMRARDVILDATVSTIAGEVSEEASQWAVAFTRLAHEMGVPISTGTDNPAAGATALFDEMEMLVESVGMTPTEVLVSATSVGAAVVGAPERLGIVRVGMVADLVVYPDNPSTDISTVRRPAFVLKSGLVVRSPSKQ